VSTLDFQVGIFGARSLTLSLGEAVKNANIPYPIKANAANGAVWIIDVLFLPEGATRLRHLLTETFFALGQTTARRLSHKARLRRRLSVF
jgi:hypothetical protein